MADAPFDSPYRLCPSCGEIVSDPTSSLTTYSKPAPCCGASGEPRAIWPTVAVTELLGIVDSQDLDSLDGRRVASIFLCTALELLLEHSLWELLGVYTDSEVLEEAVLDMCRGLDRRVDLFKKLRGHSLTEIFLSDSRLRDFLGDWKSLAETRNSILHTGYEKDVTNTAHLIRSVRGNCLPAFVELHNSIQKMRACAS